MIDLMPRDLIEFLSEQKQLKYKAKSCEAGRVTLKRVQKLCLEPVYIDTEDSPLEQLDPNAGLEGYYAVPAVSLIAKCAAYDPEGILVWLPDQSCYGTWDNDHWDVLVFPGVTWADILANPVPFINAQWRREVACDYLVPWENYEFKAGRPW